MRRFFYILVFLLPLTGARACPDLNTLEPFLKFIADRLKNKSKALPLIIEGTTYKVIPETDGNIAADILSGAYESYTIERLEELTARDCTYHVKDDKAFVNGYFTLQREY